MEQNLPLKKRPVDIFFIAVFTWFAVSSGIADALSATKTVMSPDSPNALARANYAYAVACDPLFMNPPVWMQAVTGLSAFVYGPFYIILVIALFKGWNKIQLPSVIYATMISTITGVIVFGVELFGEPQFRSPNIPMFLSINLPYVLIPIALLVRMRKPMPFTRKF